jgi:hypothetical protein
MACRDRKGSFSCQSRFLGSRMFVCLCFGIGLVIRMPLHEMTVICFVVSVCFESKV